MGGAASAVLLDLAARGDCKDLGQSRAVCLALRACRQSSVLPHLYPRHRLLPVWRLGRQDLVIGDCNARNIAA